MRIGWRVLAGADGTFDEEVGELVGFLGEPGDVREGLDGLVLLLVLGAGHHLGDADDDAAGVEVVIKGFALAEKLRRE